MADTLTFGPQWLRALSDGNTVTSPPPSPGFTKYKLAEHRYGREEMLALFSTKLKVPDKMKQHSCILLEKPATPLALLPTSEEEQRLLAQSVNSDAVLRMMGRGAGGAGIRGRGGGDRGRGRGRGRGEGYFQRGVSYEEDGFGRGRHGRGESWDDGRDKRFDNGFGTRPFDEPSSSTSPRKELSRSLSSENWRESRKDDDDEGDWRRAGPRDKWSARSSWRDHREYPERGGGFSTYKAPTGFESRERFRSGRGSGSWDDENDPDNLPDWCNDDKEDMENIGTFDSSGAFMSLKEAEAQETKDPGSGRGGNKKPVEKDKDSGSTKQASPPESRKNNKDMADKKKSEQPNKKLEKSSRTPSSSPEPHHAPSPKPPEVQRAPTPKDKRNDRGRSATPPQPPPAAAPAPKAVPPKEPTPPLAGPDAGKSLMKEESLDDQFDHLAKAAEDMVNTWSAEEDEKEAEQEASAQQHQQKPPPQQQPEPESANKWYYRDPQGDIQGPFSCQEMAEWFSAGYFTMTLLVKRGCDENFHSLGEVIKHWGRVPFIPGAQGPQGPPGAAPFKPASAPVTTPTPTPTPAAPSPPAPSTTPQPGLPGANPAMMMPPEQLKMLQQHQQFAMIQQHMLLRQQIQMQQLASVLQNQEGYQKLTPAQQQTMILQMLLQQNSMGKMPGPPLQTPVTQASQQQQRASPRPDEPPPSNLPPAFHRSLSQPGDNTAQGFHRTMSNPAIDESNSIWGSATATSAAAAAPTQQSWSQPGSVWDLEPPSAAHQQLQKNAKSLEEIQRLEMEKQQREEREKEQMEQRRKAEEMERQRLEEIRRREEEVKRQKEEEMRRQAELERQRLEEIRRREEEEKRLKEMEQQKEQQRLEQLRREQEAAMKREEERRRQEEERRRREEEERRREEEERQRQQEELERKRQEEITRRQKAEDKRRQQEALRRIQQEQLANMQLPSSAQWAQNASGNGSGLSANSALSLSEIQNLEAMQQRKEEEEKQQRLELQRQQLQAIQQQQQQQSKTWAAQKQSSKSRQPISLLEIQQEQSLQYETEKRHHTPQPSPMPAAVPLASAAVWGSTTPTTASNWAAEGAWGRQAPGFWEEPQPTKKPASINASAFPALPTTKTQRQAANKTKTVKSKKDEQEAVQRLFQSMKPKDEFHQWCENKLRDMPTSVDVPTFIGFLEDVESPYEVHDYVTSYLGDTKETRDFAQQFLERRSRHKNHLKSGGGQSDSVWSSNSGISDLGSADNTEAFEESRASKKKKKRMQKVDASFLGFTVHGAPDRYNAGGIDTGTPNS